MASGEAPFVTSVLHPSDFSESSEGAFAHALAIALHNRARLTLFHAATGPPEDWAQFPAVRRTLAQWHLLPAGSSRADLPAKLGVEVLEVQAAGKRPFAAILDHVSKHEVDLIVLATEGRVGLPRLLHPSLAERTARETGVATLVVPRSVSGFVSRSDGRVQLGRILLPIAESPEASGAIAAAVRAAQSLSRGSVELYLLHVGRAMPPIEIPSLPGCSFRRMTAEGEVVSTILGMGEAHEVDLIVMTTEGHRGLRDAVRGSVTERVVRKASCPVLAVPARGTP